MDLCKNIQLGHEKKTILEMLTTLWLNDQWQFPFKNIITVTQHPVHTNACYLRHCGFFGSRWREWRERWYCVP